MERTGFESAFIGKANMLLSGISVSAIFIPASAIAPTNFADYTTDVLFYNRKRIVWFVFCSCIAIILVLALHLVIALLFMMMNSILALNVLCIYENLTVLRPQSLN